MMMNPVLISAIRKLSTKSIHQLTKYNQKMHDVDAFGEKPTLTERSRYTALIGAYISGLEDAGLITAQEADLLYIFYAEIPEV